MLATGPASRQDRMVAAGVFVALAVWYGYTRLYWSAAALHATLPPCPFLLLTGHPCPFCGGTRSFASIWSGDLGRAIHFNPLGPALFAAGLAAAAAAGWVVLAGRLPRLVITQFQERGLYLFAGGVIVVSWILKLAWIG